MQLPLLFSGEVICPIECVNEKAGAQAWSADSTCAWLRIISSRAVCERYGHLGSSMPDVKNFPPYTSGVSRLCSAPLLLRGCIQPGKGISSKSLAGPPRDPRSLEFGASLATASQTTSRARLQHAGLGSPIRSSERLGAARSYQEVVGIHVLLTRSLFGGGIPHRLLQRVSLAKPTSASLRC